MAVIKFANGQSVNFNGNPTSADVEEVAQKLGIAKSQPTPAPTPAPLDASTKADQATFPVTGNEGYLGAAAKTLGNIPKSAFEFGKGVVSFLNPLNTIKTAQDLGTAAGEASVQPNAGQIAKDTITGLPEAAIHTLVPQFVQHLISGDTEKALQTITNDPVGQLAPLLLTARQIAEKTGKGAQFDQAMTKIASPVTKTSSAIGSAAANLASGATKFAGSQLTGLSPKTLEQIVTNPREFSQQAQTSITRPALAQDVGTAIADRQAALSDTGAEYSGVRTGTNPIPVDPTYLDKLISETTKLDVKEGKLVASGNSSVRLPSDVNALQTKLYNVWAPEFAKGYLTPEQYLNFRADLSKMAYNDSGIGKSGDLARFGEIMRGKANTDLRPHVPGLTELDAKYAPQITELKQLSAGLVDKEGGLTQAAINKIANATGKGKDPQLARLEELHPGITDKIKILKAVEDIQNSRENKPGTYTRAAVGFAGLATFNPYLVVSAVLSLPEFAVPILRGVGYSNELIGKTLNTLGISKVPHAINDLPSKIPGITTGAATNK